MYSGCTHQARAQVGVAAMTTNSEAKTDRNYQAQRLGQSFDLHWLTFCGREMLIKHVRDCSHCATAPVGDSEQLKTIVLIQNLEANIGISSNNNNNINTPTNTNIILILRSILVLVRP